MGLNVNVSDKKRDFVTCLNRPWKKKKSVRWSKHSQNSHNLFNVCCRHNTVAIFLKDDTLWREMSGDMSLFFMLIVGIEGRWSDSWERAQFSSSLLHSSLLHEWRKEFKITGGGKLSDFLKYLVSLLWTHKFHPN